MTTLLAPELRLPWPPKELNPNARIHWRLLAKAKRTYSHACAVMARYQGAKRIEAERVRVHLTFIPPNRQHRDEDGAIASLKSGLDALATVIGIDDSRWHLTHDPIDTANPVKDGAVVVRISAWVPATTGAQPA